MRLDNLADVQMGFPFRSRIEHDPLGDVAVVQMKDIDDSNILRIEQAVRVSLPKGKARHLLRKGDLLFRSRGRSNGAALVSADIEAAVLSAPMLLIRPYGIAPEYLLWFINTTATQTQLATLAEGTSVRMISAETLKALDVPLPPQTVQQRIVSIAALAEHEQTLLTQISAQRQRLITHILMQQAQQIERERKPHE